MSENSTVPQEILDEALFPELSDDYFYFPLTVKDASGRETVEKKKIQLKPLKIKYQKQFQKAFHPVVAAVAFDLSTSGRNKLEEMGVGEWASVSAAVLDHPEVMPRLIQILAHNDGLLLTDDQIDESSMQPSEMQAVILKQCKKSGEIEKRIADFFESVLPKAKSAVFEALGEIEKAVNQTPGDKSDLENTALLNQSASTTDTASETLASN